MRAARRSEGSRWQNPVLDEAQARFPKAFFRRGLRPAALKLDVARDLKRFMPEVSMNGIRRALEIYCGTRWYLEEIAKGGDRRDLLGRPVGPIDPVARRRALSRLLAGEGRPGSAAPRERDPGRTPVAESAGQARAGGRRTLAIRGEASLEALLAVARSRGYRV